MSFKSFFKSLSNSRWDIGIITTPLDDILNGSEIEVKWIENSFKNSWFADPFVLEETNDELILLVEEFYKPLKRGRIAKLWINKSDLKIFRKEVILQLDTHLSFPAFFKQGDEVYLYPENSASGRLCLYKLDNDKNECAKIKVLCDKPLNDAIATELFGEKLLFATNRTNPNGNTLIILKWDDLENKFFEYTVHVFQENVARMSGQFFTYNNKIYRPTQECNSQYGHAVTLQEVINIDGVFYFNEVRRLYSVHPKFKTGMHTFNVYRDGLIMTDALTFDRMWLRKILIALHILPKR